MIPIMTHESESTESISPAESGQGDSRPGRANRLDLLLTVVGIVAGVVFVVSLIFSRVSFWAALHTVPMVDNPFPTSSLRLPAR